MDGIFRYLFLPAVSDGRKWGVIRRVNRNKKSVVGNTGKMKAQILAACASICAFRWMIIGNCGIFGPFLPLLRILQPCWARFSFALEAKKGRSAFSQTRKLLKKGRTLLKKGGSLWSEKREENLGKWAKKGRVWGGYF